MKWYLVAVGVVLLASFSFASVREKLVCSNEFADNESLFFGNDHDAQIYYSSEYDTWDLCMEGQGLCQIFYPTESRVSFDASLTPADDGSGSLGKSDRKWNELWASVWRTENTSAIQDGPTELVYQTFDSTNGMIHFNAPVSFEGQQTFTGTLNPKCVAVVENGLIVGEKC